MRVFSFEFVVNFLGDFAMDESKKKAVLIGVIFLCMAAAGAVTYMNLEPDPFRWIDEDATTWMFCRNRQCEHSFEMNLRGYFEFLEANADHRILIAPPLSCPECDEPSCYRAVKCAKCELVFEPGTVAGTFADCCPKCGFSQIEANRKAAAAERAKLAG